MIILPSLFWGDDEHHPGPDFEILGDFTDGTYAELVAVPEENLFPLPSGWDWPEAAALPLAGLTAYRALFSRGGLRRGETVVILGAGSGVSTIAIALGEHGRRARARDVVVAGEDRPGGRARRGRRRPLHRRDGWPEQLEHGRPGRGLGRRDLAGLAVGAQAGRAAWSRFGATGGDKATINVRPFYFGQFSLLGTTMGSPRDFAGLLGMLEVGWRPTVEAVMPLDQAADAHARMEQRAHFGKLVLVP